MNHKPALGPDKNFFENAEEHKVFPRAFQDASYMPELSMYLTSIGAIMRQTLLFTILMNASEMSDGGDLQLIYGLGGEGFSVL